MTRAEVQRLRERAAADFRSIGSLVTWLVAQELARPGNARPRSTRGSAPVSDRRIAYSVLLTMPHAMRARLEAAARQEMRSVSLCGAGDRGDAGKEVKCQVSAGMN